MVYDYIDLTMKTTLEDYIYKGLNIKRSLKKQDSSKTGVVAVNNLDIDLFYLQS